MKKILKVSIIILATILMYACTFTRNQNHWIKRDVTSQKLANGGSLHVGFKAPSATNKCKLVHKEEHNWSGEEFKSMFKMSGGWSGMKDIAVKYANAHPGVNYSYLYIPNQDSIMNINVTMMRKAIITYYKCKVPPAIHHNPFKK